MSDLAPGGNGGMRGNVGSPVGNGVMGVNGSLGGLDFDAPGGVGGVGGCGGGGVGPGGVSPVCNSIAITCNSSPEGNCAIGGAGVVNGLVSGINTPNPESMTCA